MAYNKKEENSSFIKLKSDIASGELAQLYIFWGEESYLKEHYRNLIIGKIIDGGGFADFNIVKLGAENMNYQSFLDAVESIPFGAERKLVIVDDYNIFKPSGELKDNLVKVLENLPEYICLIFYFEAVEFKPDKRLAVWKAIDKHGEVVEFKRAGSNDLIPWIKRRFSAFNKTIEREECEYLVFLCGALMTNLVTEIDKIASASSGDKIKREHIDALASRVLEAQIWDMTDCIQKRDFKKAISILSDLFASKNEPIVVLSAITRQMQRMYAARLALENRLGEDYIMKVCGLRSQYPAKLLRQAAQSFELPWLRRAMTMCAQADMEIKSNVRDSERTVELLILKIAQEAK